MNYILIYSIHKVETTQTMPQNHANDYHKTHTRIA